ncbi:neurofilament heavy polypeptide [Drosophila albomicans]|uniref:Neurofilament heavy polypeptide n=1 Tax=Drosophila albomicans TaxID=7291 RepID=A0A6P8WWM5_DROAB|nr:neurofilament heavy polypeptide [Drosophila albomicans]
MSSSKKRSKDEQIPKPISIKKEKSEEDRTLQPISHYIDDRLELVKQIFGTLKPKTIMNLAPEFLKKTSLDEIEELCLNELLCISTKRLKSIIADTRCPTDTESSEDSDVEHKEEHISLEEISSDSDIGGSETRRAKKLRKSNAKRADKTNENKEPDGQISVLELLELQARARAIRSQLAMEPITKIEVKSDDEEEKTSKRSSEKEKSREKRSHRSSEQSSSKRKSSEQSRREQAQTNGSKPKETTAPAPAPAQKKIKIKRNYRTSTKTPEKEVTPVVKTTSQPEISQDKSDRSRSASPDVIPIPAEPETLLISDSTDDEATVKPKETVEQTKVVPPPIPEPEPAELSEPEEGEVREESENETEAEPVKKKAEEEQPIESTAVETEKPAAAAEAVPVESADVEKPSTSSQPIVEAEQPQLSSSIVDEEDQNDDVISIGGDLEHEMIAELAEVTDEPPVKVKPEKLPDPEEEDNDVISLNTSEDEHEKLQETNSESWRTRYLKSSKVNQVLAASRLGKRVRDKIKESKRAQKKHSEGKGNGDEKSSKQSQQQQFTSKHEDGSMEQYQELLQHRQRKSSNSSKGDK